MHGTVVGVVALFGLTALGGCGERKKPPAAAEKPPAPMVTVMTAAPGPLQTTVEVTGTVSAKVVARLTAPADGIIEALRVREGDVVRSGQVVALVSSTERVALLGETRSRAERLRARLADATLTVAARDDLQRQLAAAETDYRYAGELRLPLPVVSPIAGKVIEKPAELGSVVGAREVLLTVADLSRLVVRTSVSELLLPGLAEGAAVQVRIHAFPASTFAGRITLVGPQVDLATRTAPFEVAVAGGRGRLVPGMMATVLVVTERRLSALSVPNDAILVRPGGNQVLFVVSGDTARQRVVQSGLSDGTRTEVITGLRAGERVVLEGQEALRDGMAVRVRDLEAPPKTAGAAERKAP